MGEEIGGVVLFGCAAVLVEEPVVPEVVFLAFLPLLWELRSCAASAGVGSTVSAGLLSTAVCWGMMSLRSHAEKDGSVDNRRLMADLTETSSKLSILGQIEATGVVVFVVALLVDGVPVLLERSKRRRSQAWICLVLRIPT